MTFGGLPDSHIPAAIEALLFVSDEPVGALVLADMLEVDVETVQKALDVLRERLSDEESGVQLREVAGGWRLYTHPRYHALIEKYVISWDTRRLSQAALETLAVIAYCQPITRAGIASVRGVNSDSPVNSLVEKGLVREAGKDSSSPGQPMLYATTRSFLEKFGLASVRDLPDIDQFAPDEESRELIRERLGVTRSQAHEAESLFDEDELSLNPDFQGEQDKGSMFSYESAKAMEE
ncbi:SMC-Scp complex subunit ScpB [Slackia piriformis]|uniref:SMC-Scp complex subunit ScpB n=1 Tax=Slackia piriformis TaxID=626934 RepID=UPI0032C14F72